MTTDELRACMDSLEWSQHALSRILGVSHTTVSRWATGKLPIPENVAIWIRGTSQYLRENPLPDGWKTWQERRSAE
ncbi:helix-turn-helix domain-containing protein [Acetobacteraceae bacterium]|nr:helix-turn-helix domain-containing protein [Acetobacteraceae bacterium]QCE35369.1 helix-turn-helix domain-containing protein [Acetobacteraceae bacterium]